MHHFIRLLADKGLLLRNYTQVRATEADCDRCLCLVPLVLTFVFGGQNIDGLERIAGVPVEKVVEAHGSFFGARCIKCEKVHDPAEIRGSHHTPRHLPHPFRCY